MEAIRTSQPYNFHISSGKPRPTCPVKHSASPVFRHAQRATGSKNRYRVPKGGSLIMVLGCFFAESELANKIEAPRLPVGDSEMDFLCLVLVSPTIASARSIMLPINMANYDQKTCATKRASNKYSEVYWHPQSVSLSSSLRPRVCNTLPLGSSLAVILISFVLAVFTWPPPDIGVASSRNAQFRRLEHTLERPTGHYAWLIGYRKGMRRL
ncbi:hypothetical protein JB92DRAFT_2888789 [Gautieria morchelliformis]|nr:hypothetical protein JB92DRAFT_2888789 [Gautieria morchelliformis]